MSSPIPEDYKTLLIEIKQLIRSAQYEALKAVNQQLISLYWDIGSLIVTRQQGATWGKSIVQQLAQDLQTEFPGIAGFSARNIWRMRDFYLTYQQDGKLPPMVAEIGWSHNSLKTSNQPIGVASYSITTTPPQSLQHQLPDPAQIAKLLEGLE